MKADIDRYLEEQQSGRMKTVLGAAAWSGLDRFIIVTPWRPGHWNVFYSYSLEIHSASSATVDGLGTLWTVIVAGPAGYSYWPGCWKGGAK